MTRSAEIPDEAVRALNAVLVTRGSPRDALAAALPYLAPAERCTTCNGREWINGQWVARRETVGMVCQDCGTDYAPVPAGDGGPLPAHLVELLHSTDPAGDGGLREALVAQLGDLPTMRWALNEYPTQALPKARLLELLRLHPDRPVLNRDAVEEAIATKAYYYDSATAVHEVDDNDLAGLTAAADAIMALAVPVDREALIKAISAASNPEGTYVTPVRTYVENWADVFADAVLAVLAGEQEQR